MENKTTKQLTRHEELRDKYNLDYCSNNNLNWRKENPNQRICNKHHSPQLLETVLNSFHQTDNVQRYIIKYKSKKKTLKELPVLSNTINPITSQPYKLEENKHKKQHNKSQNMYDNLFNPCKSDWERYTKQITIASLPKYFKEQIYKNNNTPLETKTHYQQESEGLERTIGTLAVVGGIIGGLVTKSDPALISAAIGTISYLHSFTGRKENQGLLISEIIGKPIELSHKVYSNIIKK